MDAGSRQVDQAGATMTEIVRAVKRVTDIMAEIAAASNEQSAGIEQVTEAIVHMDALTLQNAALVEEAATTAESMQEQAQVLMHAVSMFKLEAANERDQINGSEILPVAIANRQTKTDFGLQIAANDKERLKAQREMILLSLHSGEMPATGLVVS